MRILEVVPYFAPAYAYGGPPETVHKLCKALVDRGNEVTVLTTDTLGPNTRQRSMHRTNKLDIYYLRNVSNYLAWNHQMFLPIGIRTFLQARQDSFDIIHTHSFRTYQSVLIRQYATRKGIPYVLSAHGSVPPIVRKKLAKRLFDQLIGRSLLEDAEVLIALSRAEVLQYESMGVPSSKINVIPNGIDPQEFSTLPPRGEFLRKYGLSGKRIVGYVGRLNARKGLDTLLESFRELAKLEDDLVLVLAGPDDGYRAHLEKKAKRLSLQNRTVFTGMITPPAKLEAFVDCSVVVYPGPFEIFGMVPFEALLCGRPVVVANDSGCGEIVAEAGAGLTVPPADVPALADAIRTALNETANVRDMTIRGRHFVVENLSWGRIAAEMESVYRTARDRAGASK